MMNSSVLSCRWKGHGTPSQKWKGDLAKSWGGAHAVLQQCAPHSTLFVHQNMPWDHFKDLHQARISPS